MSWKTAAPWGVALAFALGSLGPLAGMVEFLCVPVVVCLLLYGAIQADRVGGIGRTSRVIVVASVASAAIVASVAIFQWPLRAAYATSRQALDRLADDVRAGKAPTGAVWAGPFRISDTEISYNGTACLWTDRRSGNRVGFANCDPHKLPLCPWTHITLDQRWQYLVED
jgi:hypothetical protein